MGVAKGPAAGHQAERVGAVLAGKNRTFDMDDADRVLCLLGLGRGAGKEIAIELQQAEWR